MAGGRLCPGTIEERLRRALSTCGSIKHVQVSSADSARDARDSRNAHVWYGRLINHGRQNSVCNFFKFCFLEGWQIFIDNWLRTIFDECLRSHGCFVVFCVCVFLFLFFGVPWSINARGDEIRTWRQLLLRVLWHAIDSAPPASIGFSPRCRTTEDWTLLGCVTYIAEM